MSWGAFLLFCIALAAALALTPVQLVMLNNIMVLALFAVATNLLLGTCGLVSFGQGCFYGIGSYVVAMGWFHRWFGFWWAVALTPLLGALAALLVGLLALRSRRWFFALLTMCFSQLFFTIAQKAYGYTQGDSGIFGPMVPDWLAEPRNTSLFILAVTTLSFLALSRVTNSPTGLMLRAIRDNPRRVTGLGVNTYRLQLLAFVISGTFCAVAGMLAAVNQQAAYPAQFDWTQSGDAVLVSVIGGMYVFLGPVLGAIVYQIGHDLIVRVTIHWQLALGLLLLVVVLLFPDGLAGLFQAVAWRRVARRLRVAHAR
jgi:branched-chain amino acid transport system permease protein